MLNDPDGRWVHLVVGGLIGGIINTAVHWKQITAGGGFNLGAAGAAFGIGAVAGVLGAATGGASFAAMGGTAAGAGGFLAGFGSGAIAGYTQSLVLGVGNSVMFGDPFSMSDLVMGTLGGGLMGGAANGILAKINGRGFWDGNLPKIHLSEGLKPIGIASVNTRVQTETPAPNLTPIETPQVAPTSGTGNTGGGFHQPSTAGIKLKGDFQGFSAGKLDPIRTPLGKLTPEIERALIKSGWVKNGYMSGSTWHTTFYKETGTIYRSGFAEFHVLDWNPGSTGGVHGNGVGYFKLLKNAYQGNILYRATTNPNFIWNAGSHPPVYINGIRIN